VQSKIKMLEKLWVCYSTYIQDLAIV
jgi:hypothetical protein